MTKSNAHLRPSGEVFEADVSWSIKQWVVTTLGLGQGIFLCTSVWKPLFHQSKAGAPSVHIARKFIQLMISSSGKCSIFDITAFAFVVVFNSQEKSKSSFTFLLYATKKDHQLRRYLLFGSNDLKLQQWEVIFETKIDKNLRTPMAQDQLVNLSGMSKEPDVLHQLDFDWNTSDCAARKARKFPLWMVRFSCSLTPLWARAGHSMCGARWEALLRGPTQWRVQKYLRGASCHNDRNGRCEWAKLETLEAWPNFLSLAETSTHNAVTPNKSIGYCTHYLHREEVLGVGRLHTQS